MSNDAFKTRIRKIQSNQQDLPISRLQSRDLGGFSWGGAIQGFVVSLVIGFAFVNIQAISDMAPQSIKDGPAPGAFGAPVALISGLWIIITPIWFIRTIMKAATSGWSVAPKGFPVGLFAGMASTVLAIQSFF